MSKQIGKFRKNSEYVDELEYIKPTHDKKHKVNLQQNTNKKLRLQEIDDILLIYNEEEGIT